MLIYWQGFSVLRWHQLARRGADRVEKNPFCLKKNNPPGLFFFKKKNVFFKKKRDFVLFLKKMEKPYS